MSEAGRQRLILFALLVITLAVFLPGIDWGLPSRAVDSYLFGDKPVWSGERILSLAGGWGEDRAVGSDVDLNPIGKDPGPVWLNETDAQKAEIIRRFRLFTYQPDEMITMRALGQMRPGELKLDPKLYQYGGLWIYPVGALLKIASMVGAIHLTADLKHYLDHPEDFGRFYVVARLYTVMWGLVGVWVVYWIIHRMTGNVLTAAAGALCYIFMPVVVNMSHEAKPHLPGAVIMLLAIIAASKYVETGKTRWWMLAGALCGAAFGMVISSLPIFLALVVMVILRRQTLNRRVAVLVASGSIGVVTYFVTNPYVAINLLFHRELIQSNIGNSTAMYSHGRWVEGILDGGWFIAEGTSYLLAAAGIVGGFILLNLAVRQRPRASQRNDVGWLLLIPAAAVAFQFIMLAAGKPFEYARFGLLPDIALLIAACAGVDAALRSNRLKRVVLALLVGSTAIQGFFYWKAFVNDAQPLTSRLVAAASLQSAEGEMNQKLRLYAEPAPYITPPADLFRWQWVMNQPGNVSVMKLPDKSHLTPISWADRRFLVILNDNKKE